MPKFTTRVELHHADDDDYKILHKAMATEGFSRFISDGSGKKYRLPTAEYNRIGDLTKQQVLEAAKRAAAKAKKSASILVTEAVSRTWSKLSHIA